MLEQKAKAIVRITMDHKNYGREHTTLVSTVSSLFNAHHSLAADAKQKVAPVVASWAHAFWTAVRTNQRHTADSLRHMAGAKANVVETAVMRLNMAKWKTCIGARSDEGRKAMPNRLSYRWAKGLGGWIPSTVAPCSWNENVEEETPSFEVAVEPSIQEVHDIPLSDQVVVDKEAEEWASL